MRDCDTKHPKLFEQPVIQTLQMFCGETGTWLVVLAAHLWTRFRAARPGYQPLFRNDDPIAEEDEAAETYTDEGIAQAREGEDGGVPVKPILSVPDENGRVPLEGWNVCLLALPACCDITGTTLMNVGLLFVAASIFQMTRGALVLFVGLFSVIFLKRHLGGYKWFSLFVVVAGVALVGLGAS